MRKLLLFLLLYSSFLFSDEPVFCEKQLIILKEASKLNDKYKTECDDIIFYGSGALYCLIKERMGLTGEEVKKPNDIDIMVPVDIFYEFIFNISKKLYSLNEANPVSFIWKRFFLFDSIYYSVYQFLPYKKHIADIVPYSHSFPSSAVDRVNLHDVQQASVSEKPLANGEMIPLKVLKPAAMAGFIAASLNGSETTREIDECLGHLRNNEKEPWLYSARNVDRIRVFFYLQEKMLSLLASHKAIYKEDMKEEVKLEQSVQEHIFLLRGQYYKESRLDPMKFITFSDMVSCGKKTEDIARSSAIKIPVATSREMPLLQLEPKGVFSGKGVFVPKNKGSTVCTPYANKKNDFPKECHTLFQRVFGKNKQDIVLDNRFSALDVEENTSEIITDEPFGITFNKNDNRSKKEGRATTARRKVNKRRVKKGTSTVRIERCIEKPEKSDSMVPETLISVVTLLVTASLLGIIECFY